MMYKAHFQMTVTLLLLIITSACQIRKNPVAGQPSRSGHAKLIMYVSNADSKDIYVMQLDTATGRLTLLEKEALAGMVMPMAVHPDKRFLYASLRSEPFAVSTLSIDPQSGLLSPLSTSRLPDNMAYVSLDQSGKYLLSASYSGHRVAVNSIEADGSVSGNPLQVLQTGKNAHAVVADRTNKFVYVTNLGDDQILQYAFDPATGSLKPASPPAVKTEAGAGPRHLVQHPGGKFWFAINELNGTVTTYSANDAGALLVSSSSTLMPAGDSRKPSAAEIRVHPSGKYVYATERTSGILSAFAVDPANGGLRLIAQYPTQRQPRSFNLDPEGRFLVVAGQQSHRLSVYRISGQTGELQEVADAEAGRNPNWIEIIELP